MIEEFVKEILKTWGAPGAIAALGIWYLLKREAKLLSKLEEMEKASQTAQKQWEEKREEFVEKLISIIEETTRALTKISDNVEELASTSEKLQNIVEQLRYLRLFLEKVMRVREPKSGQTEKFYIPEEMRK